MHIISNCFADEVDFKGNLVMSVSLLSQPLIKKDREGHTTLTAAQAAKIEESYPPCYSPLLFPLFCDTWL